jgi:hypothetical protein
MISANKHTDKANEMAGFQLGRITRVYGSGQSKKLMRAIKEIYLFR